MKNYNKYGERGGETFAPQTAKITQIPIEYHTTRPPITRSSRPGEGMPVHAAYYLVRGID